MFDIRLEENNLVIDATLHEADADISMQLYSDDTELFLDFGTLSLVESANVNVYQGSYTVTPKVEAQVMETKNKKMLNDVNIRSIPFYKVSNSSGKTVYIGRDLYGD